MGELAAMTSHAVDFSRPETAPVAPAVGRPPRVLRQLALSHRIDQMIRDGQLEDLAAAAKWAGVTRARMTQIASLLLLVPSIQEAILSMPPSDSGRDLVNERVLRPIAAEPAWERQLKMWSDLIRKTPNERPWASGPSVAGASHLGEADT